MPAPVESPAGGFALSDFTNIPDPPADDTPKGPQDGGATPDTDALKTGTITEPPIKELKDDEPEPNADEAPASLEGAMRESPDAARKELERQAAEQKTKDESAAAAEAEKAKQAGASTPAATDRDADLKPEIGSHTHPKTRKLITDFQSKAKAARDERDAAFAEREALKKERDELQQKLKAVPVPKEVDDEVKALRERVRELDITRDPIIQQKYDSKLKANETTIIEVLKGQGFGRSKVTKDDGTLEKNADGSYKLVENPAAVASLLKDGLSLKTLQPYIKKLEEGGLIDDAEQIRDAVRENNRLNKERTTEIESWKADHGKRQQARESETKQQADARQQAFTQQTDVQYRAELAALEKDFAYLKPPPSPLATDTPAVKAAKEAAQTEYAAAAKRIETAVKGLNPDGLTPDKQPEVVGRINANAILALALKEHVLPSLKRDLARATKERDDAVAELNKIRDAGRISRLHGQAPSTDTNAGKEQHASLEDALRGAMPGAQG